MKRDEWIRQIAMAIASRNGAKEWIEYNKDDFSVYANTRRSIEHNQLENAERKIDELTVDLREHGFS